MAEYIDKQEVLYILKSLNTAHLELKGKPMFGFISATDLIQDIPPTDVEPVVRCRDCMYNGSCLLQSFVEENCVTPIDRTNWFCADGVKRGDAE